MEQKRDTDITEPSNATCETCKLKDTKNIAKAFCVQCQDFMCLQCSDHHFLSKLTKHHRILRENEMPLRKASTSIAELCSVHDGAACYFYCQTHSTLICYTCKDTSHTNCDNVSSVTELSHCIEKTEKYQEIRVELRHMLQLFRTLKTQLLHKFQCTRAQIERTCHEQQTLESENEEVEENLINSQVECAEKVTAEIKKTTHVLQSCDLEILLAEKLDTDFNVLEQTQQQIQLFVAMKMAEQMIGHMKSVNREIDKQTRKDTTVVRIQEPQDIRTPHVKRVTDRRPLYDTTNEIHNRLCTCCYYWLGICSLFFLLQLLFAFYRWNLSEI
ncbi:E3 ubiquitin-protein ligase TRIM71-like [Mercenaria mercenaria]|uniref:E3 ubiquitin-protein ligase TRIM71-like n=1 Tax=Mercenaria mercenaria TaxID=6596 RepID=UPI00234F8AA0|nr:E3 ubiquitin-protein ligase TRIM71-like [Mercenaria mercenaria]